VDCCAWWWVGVGGGVKLGVELGVDCWLVWVQVGCRGEGVLAEEVEESAWARKEDSFGIAHGRKGWLGGLLGV